MASVVDALAALTAKIDAVTTMLRSIEKRERGKPEIASQARYHLEDAAEYLGTSTSTLKRRAAVHKLAIFYDGKTPYVMGAEILRYARDGAKRRSPARGQRRRKGHPPPK